MCNSPTAAHCCVPFRECVNHEQGVPTDTPLEAAYDFASMVSDNKQIAIGNLFFC